MAILKAQSILILSIILTSASSHALTCGEVFDTLAPYEKFLQLIPKIEMADSDMALAFNNIVKARLALDAVIATQPKRWTKIHDDYNNHPMIYDTNQLMGKVIACLEILPFDGGPYRLRSMTGKVKNVEVVEDGYNVELETLNGTVRMRGASLRNLYVLVNE